MRENGQKRQSHNRDMMEASQDKVANMLGEPCRRLVEWVMPAAGHKRTPLVLSGNYSSSLRTPLSARALIVSGAYSTVKASKV